MRLVLVEWLDSRRGDGWTRIQDLRDDHTPIRCKSVGWVVAEDSAALTLAGHVGENPGQCCGDITIPACSIIAITDLVEPKCKKPHN